MSTLGDIKDVIREIAKIDGAANNMVFDAEVVSVQDETITIKADDMDITEVRTCALTDGNDQNIRIYPKAGSTVVCLDVGGNRRDIIVLQYSEIEKISIHKGEHTSVHGDELVKQLKNLTGRVDAIYNAINKSVPTPQDGGAGLQKQMQAYISFQKSEDYSKIEDKTLMH